ncbi:MAG TPA: hypothetical protein VFY06_11625, partial [Verrucomicrobiae bacterium]|nr:hypothetical protein [Verrucomicrobiae bacterium]
MKTKKQLDEPDSAYKKSTPVKTFSLQVAFSEPDFQKAVRVAFHLAKSAGRELDPPSISHPTSGRCLSRRLDWVADVFLFSPERGTGMLFSSWEGHSQFLSPPMA